MYPSHQSRGSLAIFCICETVDGKWGDILINCKHYYCAIWLNFSLAEMLKDRLEDKEVAKTFHWFAEFQAKNKLMWLPGLKVKMAADLDLVTCILKVQEIYFLLQEKLITSGACVWLIQLTHDTTIWQDVHIQKGFRAELRL